MNYEPFLFAIQSYDLFIQFQYIIVLKLFMIFDYFIEWNT